MSQIEDHIEVLGHMDGALAAMRQGLSTVRTENEEMTSQLAALWGNGNELAGNIVPGLEAAAEHLKSLDMMLMGAQVEAVHALVILSRVAGKG